MNDQDPDILALLARMNQWWEDNQEKIVFAFKVLEELGFAHYKRRYREVSFELTAAAVKVGIKQLEKAANKKLKKAANKVKIS